MDNASKKMFNAQTTKQLQLCRIKLFFYHFQEFYAMNDMPLYSLRF